MSNGHIRPDELSAEVERTLTIYSEEINERIAAVISESVDDLVRETRATAPVGKRGTFRKNIAADKRGLRGATPGGLRGRNLRATWYVKAPDYRLTHLIVKGHATKNGGRTRANPFLRNALDRVLPEYERKVEEAVKNDN